MITPYTYLFIICYRCTVPLILTFTAFRPLPSPSTQLIHCDPDYLNQPLLTFRFLRSYIQQTRHIVIVTSVNTSPRIFWPLNTWSRSFWHSLTRILVIVTSINASSRYSDLLDTSSCCSEFHYHVTPFILTSINPRTLASRLWYTVYQIRNWIQHKVPLASVSDRCFSNFTCLLR